MDRTPVSSSNLASVGYNSEEHVLEIEFNGGGVYRYYGVPQNVYEGLINAPSHGKYFHRNIRDEYDYEEI